MMTPIEQLIEQLIDELEGNELISQALFPLFNRLLNDKGYQCVGEHLTDSQVLLKSIEPCENLVDDEPKDEQHQKAMELVGADAEPTGRLRIMRKQKTQKQTTYYIDEHSGAKWSSSTPHAVIVNEEELQQEWVGGTDDQTKTVWLPIPIINS